MDYVKLQNDSEIECVKRFLPTFNKINNSDYKNPIKNKLQNEIDVFCYDNNDELKIQVKKADPTICWNLGKSRKIPFIQRPLIGRDHIEAKEIISKNITKIEEKYLKQNKDMSDIVLLLDEMMNPPKIIIDEIRKQILKSIFKEVWIVTRNYDTYKIY